MRRADRLFQIIQILRRSTQPVTAGQIASEVEVSRRTIYRDIADLIGQRVPITGEAGYGYVLGDDYEMPPLTLTTDEADALALGAQWVAAHPDRAVARAALDALTKIRLALPEVARLSLARPLLGVKAPQMPQAGLDTSAIRRALRDEAVLAFTYTDASGAQTMRSVWPVLLGYDEGVCLLVAWCEMRAAFRHFRVERMLQVAVLPRGLGRPRSRLLREWQVHRDGIRQGDAGSSGAD